MDLQNNLAGNLLSRVPTKVINLESETLYLHKIKYIQRFFHIPYLSDDGEAMRTSVFVDTKSEQSVHQSEKIETDGNIILFAN